MLFSPEIARPSWPASASSSGSHRRRRCSSAGPSASRPSIRQSIGHRIIADRCPARGGTLTRVGSVPLRDRAGSPARRSLR